MLHSNEMRTHSSCLVDRYTETAFVERYMSKIHPRVLHLVNEIWNMVQHEKMIPYSSLLFDLILP